MRALIVLIVVGCLPVLWAQDTADATSAANDIRESTHPRTVRLIRLPSDSEQSRTQQLSEEEPQTAKRVILLATTDEKKKQFAPYYEAMIGVISNRWCHLLGSVSSSREWKGRVILQFKLHQDGRVSEMKVSESTVSELPSLMCQKAVLDLSPYSPWPKDMRKGIEPETDSLMLSFDYIAEESTSKEQTP